MTPSSGLLERLFASRFLISRAQPSVGVGERRSKAKGAGLEFADYRPYQQGDDVKHLDFRLLARLGETHIRQYSLDRQLPVTVIVDGSASMRYGTPDKYDCARTLAQLLGFVGLAGGDRVQSGVFTGGKLHWSPRLHGVNRAEILFGWLSDQEPQGDLSFKQALSLVRTAIQPAGLLILISDWWVEDFTRELDALQAHGHEIVALHVVAPEESDPASLGSGAHYIVDTETGEEIEMMLDAETLRRYRAAFAERCTQLQAIFTRRQSRYFQVSSAVDPDRFFLRDLRKGGVIL